MVLGGWLELDLDWDGSMELNLDGRRRRLPLDAWRGLVLPRLRPGEVLLAPPPRLRLGLGWSGQEIRLTAAFETLTLHLAESEVHPVMQ